MDTLLGKALWLILMSAIMGWLARGRLRRRKAEDVRVLRYPVSALLIGVVAGGLFGVLAVLSYLYPDNTSSPEISLLFVGFAVLGATPIWGYFRVRHRIEPEGLQYRKYFGKPGQLRWTQVSRIDYSGAGKWFTITTHSGDRVRLSAMLVGLPEFAQAVLREVHRTAIGGATRHILEETSVGNPPAIWK